MAEFADHQLHAVWFQGSREGGADVALYTSELDRSTGKWNAPKMLIEREHASTEIGRRLKTLGNPVLFTARNGRTWLFFVTVSLFGWSGGDVNFQWTDNSGETWTPAKRINLSPIPHSGTLVKGSVLEYADGTLGLPVYRSYDQYSFAEFVRLDASGEVLRSVTMSNGSRGGLQPSVVPLNDKTAVAFMRYNGDDPKRILRSETDDAGQSWTTPSKTDLPNPDSAVAAIGLSDHSMIMVFNNSTEYRNVLTLARSTDTGATWKLIHTFNEAEAGTDGVSDERSYPSLLRTENGDIHLVYTWKRRKIKHIIFNESWIRTIDE
ncbi:MAG: sialidase family protein [Acidobacteriota bacterium]